MPIAPRWILVGVLLGLPVPAAQAQQPSAPEALAALQQGVTEVIAGAERSVVAIARVRREKSGELFNFEFRPDPFGRRHVPSPVVDPTDPDFIPNEYGTGVAIDPSGLILTAYHVLGPDSDYYVTTHDRKVYPAQIKAADPRSDLAVLSIAATNLEPIRFGDAAQMRKGQFVVALGNPYAVARDGRCSASYGIVANLGRKAPPTADEIDSPGRRTLHQFGTLIQTDARLNQGTSGGPLLNLRGEMVGLAVALGSPAGYEQAAGYAIPIDATFRRVIDTLKQGREVEYGFLGVRPANLRAQEMVQGRRGVRVQNVVPGTPADRFGLRPDDVITAVSGKPIDGSDSLMLEVGRMPAETQARFTVLRGGQQLEVPVTLAKYPVQGTKIVTAPAPAWRGLRVEYTTAVVGVPWAGQFRAARFDDGVVVTESADESPAWKAGLRPGVLITHVEQIRVGSPRQFQAAVEGKKGPVALRVSGPGEEPPAVHTVAPGP